MQSDAPRMRLAIQACMGKPANGATLEKRLAVLEERSTTGGTPRLSCGCCVELQQPAVRAPDHPRVQLHVRSRAWLRSRCGRFG